MGYFDSVKEKAKAERPPSSTNVTRLTPNGRDNLHPYARRVVEEELARLDQCRSTPVGHPPHWDDTTYAVACNLLEIANSPWAGYTTNEAWADLSSRAPRDAHFDERRIAAKWESAQGKVGLSSRDEPIGDLATPSVTVLGDTTLDVVDLEPDEEAEFWAARPILTHLRTFAHARMVSPWGVLGVTLARVLVATPNQVCIPPIIGGRQALNIFVGLVGDSGAGKGAAEAVAAEALDVGVIRTARIASGEAIAHVYKHRVKGELDPQWRDDTHAALIQVSEIDRLAGQASRQGATIMADLRSAWSGEDLGQTAADSTRSIPLEGHQYRLCMVAGIQPTRASCLLDDSDGGTPQRFLWFTADNPDGPTAEPEAPPPISWIAPPTSSFATFGGIKINVCQTAIDTVRDNRRRRNRREGGVLDGHALLARLKTAAALGVLDGRYSITDEDWRLAGVIAKKSDATRAEVVKTLSMKAAQSNAARADAEAKRVIHVSQTVADDAVKRICKTVTNRLTREVEPIPASVVRKSVSSRDRKHFEEAVERLVSAGQIVVQEGAQGEKLSLTGR